MDELAAQQILKSRDEVVMVLRRIADRLAVLSAPEAREPLRRLTATVDALAREADGVLGRAPARDEGRSWRTVVFVRRGADREGL
jgi:hypothetical protein